MITTIIPSPLTGIRILHVTLFLLLPFILSSQAATITMTPLPREINTPDHEELGRWNVDGRSLIFTRMTNKKSSLYEASFDSIGNLVQVEKFPFDTVYRGGGHSISPDGKRIVFTLCGVADGLGDCDLYQSKLMNGKWSSAENMGPGVNGTGWEGQPVYGLDGLSIYFVSTRPGGFGKSDIWITYETSQGKWTDPVNAGPGVNTFNYEGSPFIHFDGHTMYFMRDGAKGFGGYDLYISRLNKNGIWDPAVNMDTPINTASNEGGLAIHPDGTRALITRSTTSHRNDLVEFVLPKSFRSAKVNARDFIVLDAKTGAPLRARLDIFEINGRDTIRKSQLADVTGKITVALEHKINYGIIASCEGYIMHSLNLQPEEESGKTKIIKLIPVGSSGPKSVVLQNVFFESGSHALLEASEHELSIFIKALASNPKMIIEIGGHTDDIGSESDNQRLSELRAKAVYDYLLEHGISASRLTYKGFGETNPIASNETEDGRRQNRRTEFTVVK